MTERDTRIVLGSLLALVALATPSLGEAPTQWKVGAVHAHGLLGPLVRAAHGSWDVGVLRAPALAAGLLVGAAAGRGALARPLRAGSVAIVSTIVVAAALLVPAVALQAGLRDATAPWFHDNDSTYQIDIAGDLVRDGTNPYGHDYRSSGMRAHLLARRQPRRGRRDEPGAAPLPLPARHRRAWRRSGALLPAPLDDIRFLVCLASLAMLAAAWAFPGPPWLRLVLGAVLAANPLTIRAAWFGTADALSLAPLVLAFALVARRRLGWAAVALGSAILLKQFAIVAVPFLGIVAWQTVRTRGDATRGPRGARHRHRRLPAVPRLGPGRAASATRSSSAPAPTASSATGSPTCSCAPTSSSAPAPTRSSGWRSSSGCR